tara:strand:- start:3842 stop:4246 length:405 start_codon:yes stop_codon:yes gene_type:complete
MAIFLGNGRNPLDINKNVKIGVAFPLDENNMFNSTDTTKQQAKANLINVLLTYPGERVNMPTFGVGLKQLLFEQNIDLVTLRERIQNQINRFVPMVRLFDVKTDISEDQSTLFVTIAFSHIYDNSIEAIQLNFN